ncbi:MAG: winged helix-turn-helix domain-containing protein [Saprospiraceae bacterium]|nr:winged helix-turn-helix domain-containing protein [Saprospiraceae bacterium]
MSNLILDRPLRQAILDDRRITLTDQEFEILWVLSAYAGRSLTHQRMIEHLDENDVEIDIREILPCLLSLKEKIPPPRRLGLLGGRAMLI